MYGTLKKLAIGAVISLLVVTTASAKEDLVELAQEMSVVNNFNSAEQIVKHQEQVYNKLSKRFDKLTDEEKLQVVALGKQFSQPEMAMSAMVGDMLLSESVSQAAKLAAEDGVFFGDLSDEEMTEYVRLAKEKLSEDFSPENQQMVDAASSCPLRSFPSWISQANPGSSYVYYPYSYAEVVNNAGEWPCDWELYYSTSKTHVWGTSWFANQLLEDFGGGMSKRTYYGTDRLISGRLRTLFWIGPGWLLAQRIVIW